MSIKELLCRIFGHKEVYVMSSRLRHDGSCKKKHPKYYSPKDYYKGHYVEVYWIECSRCGRKLSKVHRR